MPVAQLGLQRFSQNVPCPVALEAVQLLQLIFSTPMPPSAQACTMEAGRRRSVLGALVQLATTPGTEDAGGAADGLLAAGAEDAGADDAGTDDAGTDDAGADDAWTGADAAGAAEPPGARRRHCRPRSWRGLPRTQ